MSPTMRHRRILTVAAAMLLCPVFSAEQPAWSIIEPLFQVEQATPPVPLGEDGQRPSEVHRFLFEDFAALSTEDLLKGLGFVLQKYPAPTESAKLDAYERDMGHKFRVLFEYYPLAARGPEDFRSLTNLVFDAGKPIVLRNYLLRQMGPGLEPRSALGSYLQSHMVHDKGKLDGRLRELTLLPQERPAIRISALEVLLARVEQDYSSLLASDPLLATRPAGEALPHVGQLIANREAFPMSRRTQLLLERQNAAVGTWAKSLKAMSKSEQQRPEVREKAREVLGMILRDYPVAGRDELGE